MQRFRRTAAGALALLTALAFAGCALLPGSQEEADVPEIAETPFTPPPAEESGAVQFADHAIVVGDGPIDVQAWIDPMCPICGQFEEAAGAELASLVDEGEITYAIHPMNFLDRASQGTAYSTRAGSALTCVAVERPDGVLDAVAALFDEQPDEGSEGLSDERLVELLGPFGGEGLEECIGESRYAAWIQESNDTALAGIEGADIAAVTGTPTLIVDGTSYKGDVTDTDAITAFVTSGGQG